MTCDSAMHVPASARWSDRPSIAPATPYLNEPCHSESTRIAPQDVIVSLQRWVAGSDSISTSVGMLHPATLDQVVARREWARCFAEVRKDHRFYPLVQKTIPQEFDYRYFVMTDSDGTIRAIQPFFILDQDLMAGSGRRVQNFLSRLRRFLPRLLTARTLMVGSTVGEGHLGTIDPSDAAWTAQMLNEGLHRYAKKQRCSMVVMKEFPATYRAALSCLAHARYTRVPSLPFTKLNIVYQDFDDYMNRALSKATRKNLRRKFRDAAAAEPIELTITTDVTPFVKEVYPLYLQVYERSDMRFEKLTPEFLCRLGTEMPDKTRFFIWRQKSRAVAFSVCMIQGESLYDEYVGLDYSVALDLHLYFYTLRDILNWSMSQGLKWYCSSALNYEPKARLKCELMPVDLYVCHTFAPANFVLRRMLPYLEPTRGEPMLRQFPNFDALRGAA